MAFSEYVCGVCRHGCVGGYCDECEDDFEKKRKPGRPKAEPTTPISVRLTKTQHAAYIDLGGARWFKRIISESCLTSRN